MRAASAVREVGKRKGVTAGQVALAWLLHKGTDIVPIPGTNSASNVEQNVAAVVLNVNARDLARLSEIFAIGAGAGERYMPNALKGVGI